MPPLVGALPNIHGAASESCDLKVITICLQEVSDVLREIKLVQEVE